jgi:phosphohistidine phosphatase
MILFKFDRKSSIMTKTLHIVRHGKSSWDFEDISDIDRPLSPRGINNAYLMAKKLSERKVVPDLFITSPANRAVYTSIIFARILKFPYENIKIEDSVYMGYTEDLIRLIRSQEPTLSNILIFGHNPAFTSLANHLMEHYLDNIPTAGIVSLTYEIDNWKEVGKAKPVKDFFDYPKRYL